MIGGFRVELPDRQAGAVELRRRLERLIEKRQRRRRRLGDETLHVELEHLRRRRQPVANRRRRHVRSTDLRRQPREDAEEIGDRSAGLHFGQQPAGVDTNHARARNQLIAFDRHGPADDGRRGDGLPDFDRGSAAESGGGGQLQAVERLQALFTIDDGLAAAHQHFAEENRGAFTHPGEPRVLRGIVERQDDDRRELRRLCGGDRRHQHRRKEARGRQRTCAERGLRGGRRRRPRRSGHAASAASSGRGPRTWIARLQAPGWSVVMLTAASTAQCARMRSTAEA